MSALKRRDRRGRAMRFLLVALTGLFVPVMAKKMSLTPGASLNGVQLPFPPEGSNKPSQHAYELRNLDPNKAYEVKVSYSATNPAKVTVELESQGGSWFRNVLGSGETAGRQQQRVELRRLLNVEKAVLSRKTLGSGVTKARVFVKVEREGVYWDPSSAPKALTYNIALEPLFAAGAYGEIPAQAIPVIFIAIGFITISALCTKLVSDRIIWRDFDIVAKKNMGLRRPTLLRPPIPLPTEASTTSLNLNLY